MEIPPLPFRSLTLSFTSFNCSAWSLLSGRARLYHQPTTRVPVFHKRGPLPDWPVGTRERVVERRPPQRNDKEGERPKEEKKEVEGEHLKLRNRGDLIDGEAGPECSQTHHHSGI